MRRATHLSAMTLVEIRRQSIEAPLPRKEWAKLPPTSPAKAVRPLHARKAIVAVFVVIPLLAAAAIVVTGGGVAVALCGAVVSLGAAAEIAHHLDVAMRWRGYRSLFRTVHPGPGLP